MLSLSAFALEVGEQRRMTSPAGNVFPCDVVNGALTLRSGTPNISTDKAKPSYFEVISTDGKAHAFAHKETGELSHQSGSDHKPAVIEVAVIDFWKYVDIQGLKRTPSARLDGWFCVPLSYADAISKKVPIQDRFEVGVGAVVVPLKFRLGERASDDGTELLGGGQPLAVDATIAGHVAVRWRPTPRWKLTVVGGGAFGGTTVTIGEGDNKKTVPALSPAASIGMQYKAVEIGVLLGVDQTIPNVDWAYDGQPWLGIGLGTAGFLGGLGGAEPKNKE